MDDFLTRIAHLPPDRLALLAAELRERLDRAQAALAARTAPIAIVGIGCRFPGGGDGPDGYWRMLRDGVDAVRETPPERWDATRLYDPDPDVPGKAGTRWGSFLDGVDRFDARFFGIAPREAVSIDPQQRLLLEVTWEALEHAGIAPDRLDGVAGSVFVGLCNNDYHDLLLERPLASIDSYHASGAAGSMAAGRIAYLLGLRGPALTVDTACSSSLVALHLACESLRSGEAELAIAGGSNLILGVETTIGLTKAHMLSPTGRCHTFDARADGIVRGEGCGVVVLKRLPDARAAGDRVLAVIRATAVNQDGRSSGITAPNGSAQEALMRAALARAGLHPDDVDYVEAHGTGTRLGDPIEVRALGEVYGVRGRERPLRIGSVKTNLGHLEAAAGIAGVLKVILALRHRMIPPHLHLTERNPLIPWERWPIEVPTTLTPWEPGARDGIRRAAVSSFGFSGTNAHVILEEAPEDGGADGSRGGGAAPAAARIALDAGRGDGPSRPGQGPPPGTGPGTTAAADRPVHVLPISALTDTALRGLAVACAEALGPAGDPPPFPDACHTAAVGRARFPERLAVVAGTGAEAADALRAWLEGRRAPGVLRARARGRGEPVFLFTGQGAQWVGMGRELFESAPPFRETLLACDESLRPRLGGSLLDVLYPPPGRAAGAAADLDRTRWTQPALIAVEVALAALWRAWGVEPAAVVGHSIGELAAAVVAGVMSLDDAAALVAVRARTMDELPSGGAMAAVLAPAEEVARVLERHPDVAIAGRNAPRNTVVSGPVEAVRAALAEFAASGVTTRELAVSHAFHSALVDPALDVLERAAAGLRFAAPEVPFVSTLTGEPVEPDTLGRPSYWREQARRPVRFADALAALRAEGHWLFLEVGPHDTLCGFGRQTLGDDAVFIPSLRRGEPAWPCAVRAAATLFVHGADLDWRGFDAPWPRRRVTLPTYPFERRSYWIGWSRRGRGEERWPEGGAGTGGGAAGEPRLLWTREWVEPGALPEGAAAAGGEAALPRAAGIAERLVDRPAALAAEHGGDVYARFLPRLDELCAAYIVRALVELGVDTSPGAPVDVATILARGALPAHRRLAARMLGILTEDGLLVRDGDGWRWTAAPRPDAPERLAAALLADFPSCRIEAGTTIRCAERLAGVLTGAVDPMELLFPGGSLEETERLYAETPSFRIFNTLAAEAVRAALEALPDGRPGRVLEVGAGTGATTARILRLSGDRIGRYAFTDVSPRFLARARERFREHGTIEYGLLDIGRDPEAQGFAAGEWDVVVASNVLHATPELRVSLAHVRRLLAPGGLLVLLEAVRPQRFGDLTVGLTPGWWSFSDTTLRPDYALLGRDAWLRLLAAEGFDGPVALPAEGAGEGSALAQQAVLLARALAPAAGVVGAAAGVADSRAHAGVGVAGDAGATPPRPRPGTGDGAASAAAAGILATASPGAAPHSWVALARPGRPSGRFAEALGRLGLPIAATVEAWPAAERAGADPVPHGILHLLALDEATLPGDDAAAALERQRRILAPAIALVRAAADRPHPPRLVFVTRSAHPAGGVPVDPTGAPLWGLGRTLALEHPEIPSARIDVDADDDASAAAIARLLAAPAPDEDELAIRRGRVLVPRIAPVAPPPHAAPHLDPSVACIVTGGLRGLGPLLATWLAERGAGRLVVNSRGAPDEEASRVLDRARAAGCEVVVVRGDIADPATAAALVDAADPRRLRGVFHCAGTTHDAALVQQDWARMTRVMAAKVAGAWNLHVATRDLPLDHFVLFSSAAAFLGSAGQANHAAANAYLGALAAYRRALGLPALAVDWGAWTGAGAATRGGVLARAAASGLGAVDPGTGFELLGRLMVAGASHVAALPVDWREFAARHPRTIRLGVFRRVRPDGRDAAPDGPGVPAGAPAAPAPPVVATMGTGAAPESAAGGPDRGAAAYPAPDTTGADPVPAARPSRAAGTSAPPSGDLRRLVAAAPPGEKRTALFEGLHAEAARALGLDAAERIDPDTPLTEFGLDSLMAVELRNAIARRLDRPLPATLLFNYPTLAELTDHLLGEWETGGANGALSEADVAERLARKLDDLQPA